MVSLWSLSRSKSPQVSIKPPQVFSILVNLNNDVVWMVTTGPLTSKSCNPFTNPLEIVLNAQVTADITDTSCSIFFFHLVLWQHLGTYKDH